MDVIQNIFGVIIMLFLLVLSGIIYINNISSEANKDFLSEQATFNKDRLWTNLDSMIKLTEPISKMEYQRLIADAIYFRNQSLVFNNITVNITKDIKALLDCSAGEGKYYFEAKPRIVELSMNFIIDGSKTLREERTNLASRLLSIKKTMEKKVNETVKATDRNKKLVAVKIYSLDVDNCHEFNASISADPDISCEVLTYNDLYYLPAPVNTSNITIDDTSLITFKRRYGMAYPFNPRNMTDITQWLKYYMRSDWGTGTAYAIWKNNKTDLSKISVFFPMSDQLSTSSIASDCFMRDNYCQYEVCSFCDATCPGNRSMESIMSAVNASREYNGIINPIFSFNCDYEYVYDQNASLVWNLCAAPGECGGSNYCSGFGTNPNPTWCALDTCSGCNQIGTSICFHDNCNSSLQSQMDFMARNTQGSMINLDNISNMNLDIQDVIKRNIEKYTLSLGYKNESLVRDVVERTLTMPNNVMIDVRLWVYKDINGTYNCSFKR